jgi:CDP-diacylglycerol pyrophosphatase
MSGEEKDHMANKICKRCNKEIKKEEKQVLLKTFDNKKTYEELYFHIQCWVEDINENLQNRAIKLYQDSMSKSMGILKGIIGNGKETNQSFVLQ